MAPIEPWAEPEPVARPADRWVESERRQPKPSVQPDPEPPRSEPPSVAPVVPGPAAEALPGPEAVEPQRLEAAGSGDSDAGPAPSESGTAAVDREQLRQALSDLTAAKERVKRDAQRVEDETREALIGDLLPVLDNLDRSLLVEATDEALLEGVKLVRGQLEQVLLGYGVERIDSVGGVFDPALHEAVAVVEVDSDRRHGMVQAEWQAGYRLGDKVLRAAKVSVGKLVASA